MTYSESDILIYTENKNHQWTIDQAMQLAILEAKKGYAFVSPNPLVGCVVLSKDFQLISFGYHMKYGEGHAEVNALKNLNDDQLKDSIVIVTLEPCAHEGKTPSCAKILAKLPIKKVIYGLVDPNPLVAGQGAHILQTAGIEAVLYKGQLENELQQVPEIFLKNFNQKKIFISMKVAQSIDGQIALQSGESQWITGPESRFKVHQLRAAHDAILIGANTLILDNPSLNIRNLDFEKENKVIILDRNLNWIKKVLNHSYESLLQNWNLTKVHKPKNIFFGFLSQEDTSQNLDLIKLFRSQFPEFSEVNFIEYKDLSDLHLQLWQYQIRSVFVEGGAKTYSLYLHEKQVDRIHIFTATSIIGSGNGKSWTENLKINQLQNQIKIENIQTEYFNTDQYLTGLVRFN